MFQKKLLAHKGVSALAPENTLSAFKKALELGFGGIELDVHLSKDGYLVVCHDETVDRTTNGKGRIKDLKLEEIKRLDAGSWFDKSFAGEQIPTLEEVFMLFADRHFVFNLELKSGIIFYPEIERKLVAFLQELHCIDRVIVSSFNHYSLVTINKLDEEIKTGMLYYEVLVKPWEYAQQLKVYSLHPFHHTVTEEMIAESSKHGFKVIPFTVNEKDIALSFIKWGAEYIITDNVSVL